MRTMIATLAGLVALTSVSVQAAPLAPAKAIPVQFGAGTLNRAGPSMLRVGFTSRSLAGPLGFSALGRLLPAVVISAGSCTRAYRMDPAERSDLALYRRLGGRIRARVSERGERHHKRQCSQA